MLTIFLLYGSLSRGNDKSPERRTRREKKSIKRFATNHLPVVVMIIAVRTFFASVSLDRRNDTINDVEHRTAMSTDQQ
jgi:hypothetical protein